MDDHDSVDRMIDSALANYGQPPEDLERRVFTALSRERVRPAMSFRGFRHRWILWTLATSAAVALLLSLVLRHSPTQMPEPQIAKAPSAAISPAFTTNALHAAPHLSRRSLVVHTARHQPATQQRFPKLDIFPTPQPLTPAEQALVTYVAEAPASERQALVEAQQKQNEPIHIAAIEIAPLESSTSHGD